MEQNNFLEGLKMGKGCGFGVAFKAEMEARIDGVHGRFKGMEKNSDEMKKKLDWIAVLIIALIFAVGGELFTRLIPVLIR